MIRSVEKIEKMTLQLVVIRGITIFPSIPQSVEISDKTAKKICMFAKDKDEPILLVSPLDLTNKKCETVEDFQKVGTVAKVKDYLKLPNGNMRIVFDGLCRATLLSTIKGERIFANVLCKKISIENEGGIKGEALLRETAQNFEKFAKFIPNLSEDIRISVKTIKALGYLADYIACNLFTAFEDKQDILNEFDPFKRLERVNLIMEKETRILETELSLHKKVVAKLESHQREHYLREQMRVIQNELGYGDGDNEIEEYLDAIREKNLPEEVEAKLIKEVYKLQKMPFGSAESAVIRSYLDTCIELPWTKATKDRLDTVYARKILDRDHDGLEKVKERIIEYLSVKQLNPELKNQIICLVGPPGTGKTSVAQSIATAMNRKYVRVALGGIRDEADIRGHRKTYIGSMPGRIINALVQAKVRNPLILLDEVDKLTRDSHGDPSSALLEVLDGEQNKNFRDHFIELPFDLSECVFIATANTLDTIPKPLLDRMEVIELKIYTRTEKLSIAKNHLIPKQLKRHGLTKKQLRFDDSAIFEIADYYTREAGVRNLEREIASICRKAAKKIVEKEATNIRLNDKNIVDFLGGRKVIPDKVYERDEIGTVNGLAYTSVGGDLLRIEAVTMPGTGKIELTGSLGDVMKESAKAAVSYIRSNSERFAVDPDFYKNKDIHIHVPEGAVPKDGPSAGVTLATALLSELTNRGVRRDVAMTGEITLHGRVLAIGGLREKTMAAYKAGVKTVLIPADNLKDLEELDRSARDGLNIIPCDTLDDVFKYAFTDEEIVSKNAVLESMRSTPTYDIPEKPTRPTRSV
ncbi:MAG: endopeptidase La [Ruminococcaceae bacterium]|nr:endopeptidase La [Oscillospiraceae bacterium]